MRKPIIELKDQIRTTSEG